MNTQLTLTTVLTGCLVLACEGTAPTSPAATSVVPPVVTNGAQSAAAPPPPARDAKESTRPPSAVGAAAPTVTAPDAIRISVTNPLAMQREAETIALDRADLVKVVSKLDVTKVVVVDATGKLVLSQLVDVDGNDTPDALVFQTDLGPNETKSFSLKVAQPPEVSEEGYKSLRPFCAREARQLCVGK